MLVHLKLRGTDLRGSLDTFFHCKGTGSRSRQVPCEKSGVIRTGRICSTSQVPDARLRGREAREFTQEQPGARRAARERQGVGREPREPSEPIG